MVTVKLPAELEQAISEKARQQDTSLEMLALDALRERFLPALPTTAPVAQNLADFLGEFVGCIHTSEVVPGGAQMSIDSGRKFAELLAKKHREAQRLERAKLTAEESLKRMEEFPQRKEQIVAAVQKSGKPTAS